MLPVPVLHVCSMCRSQLRYHAFTYTPAKLLNMFIHDCAQGLDSLDYKEHIDYDLVESTNPAFGKAIVRVNVFRHHRQVGGRRKK